MAKRHSSEAFYYLNDPLEAAVFSVLVEMMKKRSKGEDTTKETENRSNLFEMLIKRSRD